MGTKSYRIESTPRFERELHALDRKTANRIVRKIDWLASHPDLAANPLRNMPAELSGLQKYRVGDYRILFWIDHSQRIVTLYKVAHRSRVYRDLDGESRPLDCDPES